MRKVVAVYDVAIESYGTPVYVSALGAAMRSFEDEIKSPESVMHKHPEDYSLYQLGDFDEVTGKFEPVLPPRLLLKGADCKPSSS